MSAISCLLSEDQFLCPICLDVFTDPVTIPCGHNFCKTCITEYWDTNAKCQCPNCNKGFVTMPELQINTTMAEMAALFRQAVQEKASSNRSEPQVPKLGEVPCDVCTGTKMKALKSCLVCLASYCETHLEPHLTASRLKRHQLIDPVENPESRMCVKHEKILELFCRTDRMSVCRLCTALDHKTHDVVPLGEEYGEKKAELEKTDAEIQQMIQKRRLKIQEFRRSVELSKEDADRETADGVQVFTALKESVERHEADFINTIKTKHRQTERQAEDYMEELQQEIFELQMRSSEVEQLSHSEDHLHLVQSFSSIGTVPPTKDWSKVSVSPSYLGSVRAAVNQLEETVSEQMKKVFEVELKRIQPYAVDVTFDPDRTQPSLILSDDGKQVTCHGIHRRFSHLLAANTLAKQGFLSGRFYYEVRVEGKNAWELGVVKESIHRNAQSERNSRNGYWILHLRNANEYTTSADQPVSLPLKSQPKRVGVFVDYEEGLVSFYDADPAALIYSFTGCVFTEKLYPYCSPGCNQHGINSAPLIICPVKQAEM